VSFPALTDNALPEPRTDGYSFGTNVETTIDTNVLLPDKQAAANAGTPSPDGRAPATTWRARSSASSTSLAAERLPPRQADQAGCASGTR